MAVHPGAGLSSPALILSTSPRLDQDVHKLTGRHPDRLAALSCGQDPYHSISYMRERQKLEPQTDIRNGPVWTSGIRLSDK